MDLGGEEDESRMGTPMGTPRPYTPVPGAMPTSALTQNSDERGKVKLLKLVASHVTPSGGTGQCEWVRKVLNELVNDYLALWNAPVLEEGYSLEKGLWEREETARRLEQEFADLKWFDDVAGDESVDWFEELEKITGTVERLVAETRYVSLHTFPKGSKMYNDNEKKKKTVSRGSIRQTSIQSSQPLDFSLHLLWEPIPYGVSGRQSPPTNLFLPSHRSTARKVTLEEPEISIWKNSG